MDEEKKQENIPKEPTGEMPREPLLPRRWRNVFLCCLGLWLMAILLFAGPPVLQAIVQEIAPPAEDEAAQGAGAGDYLPLVVQPLDTRYVVVLDAGHGGYDPGALDQSKTITEAETNQILVDRVLGLLARHEDSVIAVQAAVPGAYTTPMMRTNTAVRMQADLMISLHLNADTSSNTRGYSVFPTPPGRVHYSQSLHFAQLLTQQVRAHTQVPIRGSDGIQYCYYVQNAKGSFNKEIVDAAWVDVENLRPDESFGVVEFPGCPAVLVEQWHISSPEDMALFYSEEGFDTMARCIYQAICVYFEIDSL